MAGTQSQPRVNLVRPRRGEDDVLSAPVTDVDSRAAGHGHHELTAPVAALRHAAGRRRPAGGDRFRRRNGDLGGLPHPWCLADGGRGPRAGADHALPLRSRSHSAGPAAPRPHRARHGDPGRHHGDRRRVLRARSGRDPGLHPDGHRGHRERRARDPGPSADVGPGADRGRGKRGGHRPVRHDVGRQQAGRDRRRAPAAGCRRGPGLPGRALRGAGGDRCREPRRAGVDPSRRARRGAGRAGRRLDADAQAVLVAGGQRGQPGHAQRPRLRGPTPAPDDPVRRHHAGARGARSPVGVRPCGEERHGPRRRRWSSWSSSLR